MIPMEINPLSTPHIILAVDHLSVMYQHGDETRYALHDIQFQLSQGETLGLVGESGGGKSLLLKTLVNQLPANFYCTSEAIHLFPKQGDKSCKLQLGHEVTFIPQDPMNALNPVRTILQHFQEQLHPYRLTRQQERQKILNLLNELHLVNPEELLPRYPHQLSGGMAQRILIALAFITEPKLVICDEVTTALDVVNQQYVISLIKNMQQRFGTSILFVTHDLAFVAQHCHRLMVMYAGEIVEKGEAREVMNNATHPYTRSLLASRPTLSSDWQYLSDIPGHMPAPGAISVFSCCRFAPRCAYKQSVCQELAPPELSDMRSVRCHFSGKLPENVSVDSDKTLSPHTQIGHGIPFLRVEGLGKSYVTQRRLRSIRKPVLSDLNFTVSPGEFIGVLGESGSGKSTLARLIAGGEAVSEGNIVLNGQKISPSKQATFGPIQMIFQNNYQALNPHRNVANLLTQSMESRSYLRSERQSRAVELASLVGLPHKLLESYPAQLSGGQRQRVNIGRALCTMPQLLIADEIVSGLDVSVQARILNLLLELRKQQKFALLLISHDLAVVNYLCHRVIVLHQGEIVEQGITQEVFHTPKNAWTQKLINNSRTERSLL